MQQVLQPKQTTRLFVYSTLSCSFSSFFKLSSYQNQSNSELINMSTSKND